MKKIYAFLAAALISVCAFASREEVPTDAVLLEYYTPGQVCACIYVPVEIDCNSIVFTGSFNGWSSSLDQCAPFEAVEGFDGWYVVAVDDESESPEGKPIILDADGGFNWDYQIGAATHISGGVQVVEGAYAGEIDLKEYSKDVPNIYTVDAWKKNPCTAVYHNYRITVINDGCGGFVVPYLVGPMTNNWQFQQMTVDMEKTMELGAPVYYHAFKAAEGTPFQVVSGLMNEFGEIVEEPAWADIAYLQKNIDGVWGRIPGEEGDNLLLKEETEVVIDVRAEDLRWARCDESPEIEIAVELKAPEGAPEAGVEIIGFNGWNDEDAVLMAAGDGNVFTATITAKSSAEFKFREAGTWENEIMFFDAEAETPEWKGLPNIKIAAELQEGNKIVLDYSDVAKYIWKANLPQGIENVVLTEKAQKVIVDGVMYIVRDNKMFDVNGTQVR